MVNMIKKQPENSVTITHCHLKGASFSDDDMNVLCRLKQIKYTVISLPNGKKYYLSIGKGSRPDTEDIEWAGERF
jgi:hypothetical protein